MRSYVLTYNEGVDIVYSAWRHAAVHKRTGTGFAHCIEYKDQLILDRQVGQHKLLDNVAIIACGNKASDGAIASKLGTALQSRVITIEVQADYKGWMAWANRAGIQQPIIDYLTWKPQYLHDFDPTVDQLTYPCPRTWQKLSNLITAQGSYSDQVHTLALGTIGKIAAEFKAFIAYYAKLPSIQKILKDPKNADMPTDVGQVYALTGVISQALADNKADAQSVADLVTYMERMEPEMQTVCMANSLRKAKGLLARTPVMSWVTNNNARINAVL